MGVKRVYWSGMAKKAPTKAEKLHYSRVVDLGCLICEMPAEIHHITTTRGFGGRAKNNEVLPLCPLHHRLGNRGVAVHSGVKSWEEIHGEQTELLKKVNRLLGID